MTLFEIAWAFQPWSSMSVAAILGWAVGVFLGMKFGRPVIPVICGFLPALIGVFGFWYNVNEYVVSYVKGGVHQEPDYVVGLLNSGLAFCVLISMGLLLLTAAFRVLWLLRNRSRSR